VGEPFAFLSEQWTEERKNVIPAEAGIQKKELKTQPRLAELGGVSDGKDDPAPTWTD